MLTRPQSAAIFSRLRRFSSCDEVEAIFSSRKTALTRFANNTIHQNVAEESSSLSVRVAFAGRTARASTNRFDDESLKNVVKAAEALARVQRPDPDLLGMCGADTPVRVPAPSRYSDRTAALTPGDRADAVAKMVAVAHRHHLTAAGIYSTSDSCEGIFNSRGLEDWHPQTLVEVSVTMLAGDSSGWQKLNACDAADLDPGALAETAARKAVESAHPRELPPGKYTVILEPSAVLDIVGFMFWDFGGMAVLDQRSFLTGRVGAKLFGENINIWDDAAHPLQAGAPFDGEGLHRQRVQLVKAGVVQRLVYARATAGKIMKSQYAGSVGPVAATGHGFPLPNEMGEMPIHIVFAPPADPQTVNQMIASTERGLLVTRLWYIREVDPFEKILTGMTRDGTFLVENGKLGPGVLNFRFNESLLHMLSHVEAMSIPVRASGEESFDMVVPAMKVRDFNFTEVTKF